MFCLLLAAGGCGTNGNDNNNIPPKQETGESNNPTDTGQQQPNPSPPSAEPDPAPGEGIAPDDPVAAMLSEMSVEEKVGQLVIFGLEGTTLQDETREMIERYAVGGFILYKDNVDTLAQTVELGNQLKAANREHGIPLLLGIDQEGGRVDRMPGGVSKVPAPEKIAAKDDKSYTYASGQALGLQVRALGLNLDFAPVLDIDSNPDNPVIGDRAYGHTPQSVIAHGLEAMEGLRASRVVPVVKHFPGHGDTDVDSHLDLPVIHKSRAELEDFELKPFAAAIDAETDAVMVAHLLIPDLDPEYPASLSETIIDGLLRQELGFDGVVMTDDLTMQGITKQHTVGEAAVLSLRAGSDIVLIGHHHGQQAEVMETILASVREGELTEEQLDAKVGRVLRLKQGYQLTDDPLQAVTEQALNAQIAELLDTK
ncbi:hypothetical protein PA598K_02028 [Paenibacillus sp. 598K]|nr:hypothetical protein PA598K_02028 [Paenibacillus sp. 598K]